MAEAAGVVCRDDGPQGLCFYRNFFADEAAATAATALLIASPPARAMAIYA